MGPVNAHARPPIQAWTPSHHYPPSSLHLHHHHHTSSSSHAPVTRGYAYSISRLLAYILFLAPPSKVAVFQRDRKKKENRERKKRRGRKERKMTDIISCKPLIVRGQKLSTSPNPFNSRDKPNPRPAITSLMLPTLDYPDHHHRVCHCRTCNNRKAYRGR